jgi:hypothetical protein
MAREGIYLTHVIGLDAHACALIKVLGEPEVKLRGDKVITGWAFEYPPGDRHWAVVHESEHPVVEDGKCVKHEILRWIVSGETDEYALWEDVAKYLLGGRDVTYHEK